MMSVMNSAAYAPLFCTVHGLSEGLLLNRIRSGLRAINPDYPFGIAGSGECTPASLVVEYSSSASYRREWRRPAGGSTPGIRRTAGMPNSAVPSAILREGKAETGNPLLPYGARRRAGIVAQGAANRFKSARGNYADRRSAAVIARAAVEHPCRHRILSLR
jgi:hypothetical protein